MHEFRYRILVVDDDERIRRASEDVFSHFGYEVRTAGDGFEALALMRKVTPELIVSDLKMPGMSGFEFLSIVRRRFPHIPVICITGEFAATQGLPCDAFFQKGQYRPEELFTKVKSLLAESPIRPYIPKPDNAPVWITSDGDCYVLTCSECLRAFPIPKDQPCNIACELPCTFCGAQIRFILESKLESKRLTSELPAKPPTACRTASKQWIRTKAGRIEPR